MKATFVRDHLVIDKDRRLFKPAEIPVGRIRYMTMLYSTNRSILMWSNLIMVLFVLPLVAAMIFLVPYFRNTILTGQNFLSTFGIGYPGVGADIVAVKTAICAKYYLVALIATPCVYLLILMSGGLFYICRNVDWRVPIEKPFKSFFKGFAKIAKQFSIVAAILSLIVLGVACAVIWNYSLIISGSANFGSWLVMILSLVIGYFVYLVSILWLPMIAAYRFSLFVSFKNAVLLTLYYPVLSIIISLPLLAVVALLAFGSTFIAALVYMVILMFGFGYLGLMWTVYAHYVFDNTINAMYTAQGKAATQAKPDAAKQKSGKKQKNKPANNYSAQYKKKHREQASNASKPATDSDDDGVVHTDSADISVVSSKKK